MKNAEIKLKITEDEANLIRAELNETAHSQYVEDQVDHYFSPKEGRLKLRISDNETCLVHYKRDEKNSASKLSRFSLFQFEENPNHLLTILQKSLVPETIVRKRREVFYVGKTKFQIDDVENLDGTFFEIEVQDLDDVFPEQALREELNDWIAKFNLDKSKAISCSYCDLLFNNNAK